MKYNTFIKSDIEKIWENANFNEEQAAVFTELIKPSYGVSDNDASVYIRLCMSESKFYKIKKEIHKKVQRILKENQ